MPALKGLQGLYGDPQDTHDIMDEGVLEAKANPLAADHGTYGSQSLGYSGTVPSESPYSDIQVYDAGMDALDMGGTDYNVQGQEYDLTPNSHSAAWPRGIVQPSYDNPDAYALVGDQVEAIHGTDMGGVRLYLGHAPAGHEEVTHYTTDLYDAPNETIQATVTEGQLKAAGSNSVGASGHGNADPVQGYGVLNSLEPFNTGRSMRRVQHDRMPMDWTNTHGEQDVPFMGRHPVQQMPLDGPDSPYFEMGSIDGANTPWEGRIGDPTAYVQPPEPTVSPYPLSSQDVWAWG